MGKLIESLYIYDKKTLRLNQTSPMFGKVFTSRKDDPIVKDITSVLTKEIEFYRNTVLPTLESTVSNLQNVIDSKLKSTEYLPNVESFNVPSFIKSKLDTEFIPTPPKGRSLNIEFPEVNWTDLISVASDDGIMGQMKKYLMDMTERELNRAYNQYVQSINFIVQSDFSKYRSIKTLYTAAAILGILSKGDAVKNAKGSLSDYRYYVEYKYLLIRDFINKITNDMLHTESNGYLILDRHVERSINETKVITVSGKHLSTYYMNDGVIEAIYGAGNGNKSRVTLEEIMEKGSEFVSNWSSKVITYETDKANRHRDIAKKAFKDKLTTELLPILVYMDYDPKKIRLDVEVYVRNTPGVELLNTVEFVTDMVLDKILKDTNAGLFVRSFQYYLKQVKDRKAAAKMASTKLITEYLFKGIEVIEK